MFVLIYSIQQQFDESSGYPAKNCFKMITIEVNGKTAQAQITDEVSLLTFKDSHETEVLI
jgi:hypothetical protein